MSRGVDEVKNAALWGSLLHAGVGRGVCEIRHLSGCNTLQADHREAHPELSARLVSVMEMAIYLALLT